MSTDEKQTFAELAKKFNLSDEAKEAFAEFIEEVSLASWENGKDAVMKIYYS